MADPFSYWLLFMAFLAFLNTFLCYTSPTYTHNSYPLAIRHTNPLLNRIFGTWTLMSGAVRLYAALHLDDQGAQVAALITLSAAVWHWGSEWLVFGSTDWTRARFGLVLDAGSAAWIAWRLL